MNVHIEGVGTTDPINHWTVELSNIPREGEEVNIPGRDAEFCYVRKVMWNVMNDSAYVVIGSKRRTW